ncbi:ensconsin isoform X11 [Canis lupus baileyi]|uniref:Microtubule associated protein 7 n=3 Tax=Canis lupus familiaris TaxID=9615 RepID=A0A8C0M6U7_CANLF|nr:ensconsin isoform X6 [Canis lupus familiaris]XP_038382050.1 ensconsin isoform X6 [Canis lupus familiaris]XP_038510167.1 ensconsin isoform X6 [Canis lupus familiaris]|eukprot:XP_013967759.1 ensconsin isoform X4 [Canis lupus familiaris]
MPGSATAIRQERLKKTCARPSPLGLFTINEEDEQQKNGNSRRPKAPESHKVQDKKTAASSRPSAISGQNSNYSGNKPDPPLVLRVDDRQRLARERREEREKQLAAREIIWLEREERARQHYEKHLEERKKKLEEQRLKEERRRAAVEEKRRQRLEEDKERHEAVVRRTMERSQKPKQKQNRWSWGGPLHGSPSIRSAARRLQLSPWESSVVNRLLTPTHSFLARSKSTAALSGDTASCGPINIMPYKAAHSRNLMDRPKFLITPPEGSARRRTVHGTAGYKREKERENLPIHPTSAIRRAVSPSHPKARSPAPSRLWLPSKSFPHLPGTPRPTSSLPSGSVKVAPAQVRPPSPGNIRPVKREVRVEPERKDSEKEPPKVVNEPSLKSRAPLVKVEEATAEEGSPPEPEAAPAAPAPAPTPAPVPAPASVPASPSTVTASASPKTSAGTTDPEEATRLLAEKRRLAREQREKEEREKREQEELERQKREELAQKVAEERARREEESRRLEAEQAREREEQLRRQAEERERREREDQERAQKQKEEEARLREEAEKARQEREKHFQREEQERLERKKRLEEIMKRTRRTEATDKKTIDQRNGDITKGALTGGTVVSALPCVTNSPGNGEPVASPHVVTSHQSAVTVESTPNLEKQPSENGVSVQNENFEEIINLPIGSKPSRLDVANSESPEIPLNPILAFDDEGTIGPLPQVDGVQTQQTAEVI